MNEIWKEIIYFAGENAFLVKSISFILVGLIITWLIARLKKNRGAAFTQDAQHMG